MRNLATEGKIMHNYYLELIEECKNSNYSINKILTIFRASNISYSISSNKNDILKYWIDIYEIKGFIKF